MNPDDNARLETIDLPKADHFPEVLARVRAADPAAIRAWVAAYEPFIRRAVRSRMTGLRGQGAADSDDVCQSVLGSLLIRLAAGEYDLGSAADLEKLLFVMIRNKVAGLARREAVSQRSRVRLTDSGFVVAADSSEDPAQLVADRDLLTEVHARLTAADQMLLKYRREGRPWDEIAGLVGGSALVLRKRFSRALQQVAIDLGLEDDE